MAFFSCTFWLWISGLFAILSLRGSLGCAFDGGPSLCTWEWDEGFAEVPGKGLCLIRDGVNKTFTMRSGRRFEVGEKAGCQLNLVGMLSDAHMKVYGIPIEQPQSRTLQPAVINFKRVKLSRAVVGIQHMNQSYDIEIKFQTYGLEYSGCITDIFFSGSPGCSESLLPESTFEEAEATWSWKVTQRYPWLSWRRAKRRGYLTVHDEGEIGMDDTVLTSPMIPLKRPKASCKLVYWTKSKGFEAEHHVYNPMIWGVPDTPGKRTTFLENGIKFINDKKWHRASVNLSEIRHITNGFQLIFSVMSSYSYIDKTMFGMDNLRLSEECTDKELFHACQNCNTSFAPSGATCGDQTGPNRTYFPNGTHEYVIPTSGLYRVTAQGAEGGVYLDTQVDSELSMMNKGDNSKFPAHLQGHVMLLKGTVITLAIGQAGLPACYGPNCSVTSQETNSIGGGGGGGGTYMYSTDRHGITDLVLVAGGGAGLPPVHMPSSMTPKTTPNGPGDSMEPPVDEPERAGDGQIRLERGPVPRNKGPMSEYISPGTAPCSNVTGSGYGGFGGGQGGCLYGGNGGGYQANDTLSGPGTRGTSYVNPAYSQNGSFEAFPASYSRWGSLVKCAELPRLRHGWLELTLIEDNVTECDVSCSRCTYTSHGTNMMCVCGEGTELRQDQCITTSDGQTTTAKACN